VPRSSEYNLGTELILLLVRAFDEFSNDARVDIQLKSLKCQIGMHFGSSENTE
jgi:hypothetical protein